MSFVARMAVREIRASWRRLLFFFLCISIGVGAIVALRSVIQSVRAVFSGEARALLAADATISSTQAVPAEIASKIDRKSTRLNSSHAITSRMPSSA